jgi:hypothetical protein
MAKNNEQRATFGRCNMRNFARGSITGSFVALLALSIASTVGADELALVTKLTSPDSAPLDNDRFGAALAIGGGSVFVSAPNRSQPSLFAQEAVYEFDLDGNFVRTIPDPLATFNGHFGWFGALSLDGSRLLIGDRHDSSGGVSFAGGAYLINLATGSPIHVFYHPVVGETGQFGTAVGLSGNDVVVGAWQLDGVGEAYLYDATAGSHVLTFANPSPDSGDEFGFSVAVEAGLIAVGAPRDDTVESDGGAVYLFDAAGNLLRTFFDPHPNSTAEFGRAVAFDAGRLLIGAPGDDTTSGSGGSPAGSGFLFDASTGALLQQFAGPTVGVNHRVGANGAISGERVLLGDGVLFVGSNLIGQALLYDATTGALLQTIPNPTAEAGDSFGGQVAIDGDHAVIADVGDDAAAPNAGAAYIYGPGVITVTIDIKPGSDPNSINLGASGVIPVAIFSTDSFDAPASIDADSLFMAGARVRVAGKSGKSKCHNEDANGDGLDDLICQFDNDLNAQEGDSVAVVEGETLDGTSIRGEDSIRIVPN